jgi:polyferredoxin
MIGYLVLADLQNTAFSGFFAFAERVIYPAYEAAPRLFGISVMDDQATAGAIMWVPGSLVYLLPVGWLVGQMLSSPRPAPLRTPVLRTRAATRRFDIGPFLSRRWVRPTAQTLMLVLAAAVIVDGLLGPSMSPMNLAGVLPWTHWRGLTVIGLLVVANVFCFACPFMLPRALARRLLPAGRSWPTWLRTKWLAVGLLVVYLWAYEAFDVWDSPAVTAWIVIGYFVAAAAVDGLFRGASFCKYVCPIGQFHFVSSTISPFEVQARSSDVCASCETTDCISGNATRRGCELELFVPNKVGNLDCTFCMDCIHACPHDNIGVLPVVPGADLTTDPPRSSLGRLSRRPDLAVLALVIVFGAFANAAGMVAPFATETGASLGRVTLMAVLALVVGPVLLAGLCTLLGGGPRREAFCRFSLALIPLGFAMWLAHFGFHLATGAGAILPVAQRLVGIEPDWSLAAMSPPAGGLLGLELFVLGVGLLLTLWVAWRVARSLAAPHSLRAFVPWAALATGLWLAGLWILLQPMQMRGMMMH